MIQKSCSSWVMRARGVSRVMPTSSSTTYLPNEQKRSRSFDLLSSSAIVSADSLSNTCGQTSSCASVSPYTDLVQALFRSWVEFASERQRKDRIAAIERSTVGVIFAGTPHRGSDATKWAAVASKVANLVGKDHSTRLTHALERGSDVVQNLEEWFKEIQSNFHIFSFYEEKPVAAIGTVVDSESAKISCEHEKVRMLHGNHMDIVRYGDGNDNSYRKVKDAFKQIHQHDLEYPVPRVITQPPPRRQSAPSIQRQAIENGSPGQVAGNRMLEYNYSRLNLGSSQTLPIEEVIDTTHGRRYSDNQRPQGLAVHPLNQLPHRASSATLNTIHTSTSRHSDHSNHSSGSRNSATDQARTQYCKSTPTMLI